MHCDSFASDKKIRQFLSKSFHIDHKNFDQVDRIPLSALCMNDLENVSTSIITENGDEFDNYKEISQQDSSPNKSVYIEDMILEINNLNNELIEQKSAFENEIENHEETICSLIKENNELRERIKNSLPFDKWKTYSRRINRLNLANDNINQREQCIKKAIKNIEKEELAVIAIIRAIHEGIKKKGNFEEESEANKNFQIQDFEKQFLSRCKPQTFSKSHIDDPIIAERTKKSIKDIDKKLNSIEKAWNMKYNYILEKGKKDSAAGSRVNSPERKIVQKNSNIKKCKKDLDDGEEDELFLLNDYCCKIGKENQELRNQVSIMECQLYQLQKKMKNVKK